jgi:hypothetical protein
MLEEDLTQLSETLKQMVVIDAPVNIGNFRCHPEELLKVIEEAQAFRWLINW